MTGKRKQNTVPETGADIAVFFSLLSFSHAAASLHRAP